MRAIINNNPATPPAIIATSVPVESRLVWTGRGTSVGRYVNDELNVKVDPDIVTIVVGIVTEVIEVAGRVLVKVEVEVLTRTHCGFTDQTLLLLAKQSLFENIENESD